MKKQKTDKGFSLIELIIVIAIMAVLVVVCAPMYIKYIHKAGVARDWANLRLYYDEIQADYISTGEYNPKVKALSAETSGETRLYWTKADRFSKRRYYKNEGWYLRRQKNEIRLSYLLSMQQM